jgi:hypothetical protein
MSLKPRRKSLKICIYFSLMGGFSVPAKFYPWIVLLISQFIMPGVSFIGHFSGMMAGYFYVFFLYRKGYWDWICLKFDDWTPQYLKSMPSFMALNHAVLPVSQTFFRDWMPRSMTQSTPSSHSSVAVGNDSGTTGFQGRGRVLGHQ